MAAPFAKRVFLAYGIRGRDGSKYRVTGRPVPSAHLGVSQAEGRRRFGISADAPVLAFFGALAGALVGLLAAASFYALAPLLGYSAMFVSWMALWIGFAFLDAKLRGAAAARETLVRGVLAAIGSGIAFWAISGIWLRPSPGGPRYAYNFACWTLAFLPGFLALLLRGRPARS